MFACIFPRVLYSGCWHQCVQCPFPYLVNWERMGSVDDFHSWSQHLEFSLVLWYWLDDRNGIQPGNGLLHLPQRFCFGRDGKHRVTVENKVKWEQIHARFLTSVLFRYVSGLVATYGAVYILYWLIIDWLIDLAHLELASYQCWIACWCLFSIQNATCRFSAVPETTFDTRLAERAPYSQLE